MTLALAPAVTLPGTLAAPTWRAPARAVLPFGAAGWAELLKAAVESVKRLRAVQPLELALWVGLHEERGEVTLGWTCDGPLRQEALDALIRAMGEDWSYSGVWGRAEGFPVLRVGNGDPVHLWEPGPLSRAIHGAIRGHKVVEITLAKSNSRDFLLGAGHAPYRLAVVPRDTEDLLRAFARTVAEAIAAADGEISANERAFLQAFPLPEGVQGGALRDLAESARVRLPSLLGVHHKLAWITAFFGMVTADGRTDVRELVALREAATALGLSNPTVMAQLGHAGLWRAKG